MMLLLGFVAGWVACALRVYYRRSAEPVQKSDPLRDELLRRTRQELKRFYAKSKLPKADRERLLRASMETLEREWAKMPMSRKWVDDFMKGYRPTLLQMVEAQVQAAERILATDERPADQGERRSEMGRVGPPLI